MKTSLKQYLKKADQPKPSHQTTKSSQKETFENWLNSNFEQKNLKNHDMHIEEYEEVPEENLHPLDYRIEIEKRFRNSVVNKIFIFPRKENEISISSDNSSLDSIKPVRLYDLASQNFEKYVKKEEETQKLKNEIPLGVNYKQFLNILEKTIKNVNINDLKKIKINNFFKKNGNGFVTPHFLSGTNKETKLKTEKKFSREGSVGKSRKRTENSAENRNPTQKSYHNMEKVSKKNEKSNNENANGFIQGKKLNINPRATQAMSFTRNNISQANSPSYSINKTYFFNFFQNILNFSKFSKCFSKF